MIPFCTYVLLCRARTMKRVRFESICYSVDGDRIIPCFCRDTDIWFVDDGFVTVRRFVIIEFIFNI